MSNDKADKTDRSHQTPQKFTKKKNSSYSLHTRNTLLWITVYPLARKYTLDECPVSWDPASDKKEVWIDAMRKNVRLLEQIDGREVVKHSNDRQAIYEKLFLKRKRDGKDVVQNYESRHVSRVNIKIYCDKNTFYPIPYHSIIKLELFSFILQGWTARHSN